MSLNGIDAGVLVRSCPDPTKMPVINKGSALKMLQQRRKDPRGGARNARADPRRRSEEATKTGADWRGSQNDVNKELSTSAAGQYQRGAIDRRDFFDQGQENTPPPRIIIEPDYGIDLHFSTKRRKRSPQLIKRKEDLKSRSPTTFFDKRPRKVFPTDQKDPEGRRT